MGFKFARSTCKNYQTILTNERITHVMTCNYKIIRYFLQVDLANLKTIDMNS